MDAKRFGAFISERRKEHHMAQADLAGKVGVTDKAVSRWERDLDFRILIQWNHWLRPGCITFGADAIRNADNRRANVKKR